MNIAYLAAPYSHPDPKIKKQRHAMVNRQAYQLMCQGVLVYSPLTHNLLLDQMGIHGDWATWKEFDHEMLARCDRLLVLKLPGWEESKGVAAEIEQARHLGMPIEWIEVDARESDPEDNDQPTVEELTQRLRAFSAEREWEKFQSPKNLAMTLGVEVGELMEPFRWLTEAQSYLESPEELAAVQDEIGDVCILLLQLSDALGIDPMKAASEKLTKIAKKYPADKCKGLSHKYTSYERC